MLLEEAKYLGYYINSVEQNIFPMINIGSSTGYFRTEIQPHINEYIFDPLQKQNKSVIHADIKQDNGVDLVGDLNDPAFISTCKSRGVKSVLCANLLEHVISPYIICIQLQEMVSAGGLIIVTVPHLYPYHKDPIDTKFRPSIDELCHLFPNCTLIKGDYIKSTKTQMKIMLNLLFKMKFLKFVHIIQRWLLPLEGIVEWKKALSDIPNINKKYQVTVVVLKKNKD